ncbi:MAG: hypothetical protein DME33_06830, partial [Verrucomicrobia bacterium]
MARSEKAKGCHTEVKRRRPWSGRMRFRYRWAMLLLYAISPILVYGGELRRPDHQSFAMLLVTIANCAEVDF